MKFWYKSSLLILTGILIILIYKMYSLDSRHIVINEICSNNFSLFTDEEGIYSDYVELYNAGSAEIRLDGYYLSDDENYLLKYPLDSVTIPPQGYYVVWLDGMDDPSMGRTGFKISRRGDNVFLSNKRCDIIDSVAVPELSYNTVYARISDGGNDWGIMTATAGGSNAQAGVMASVELEDLVFSAESGFYDEPFRLEITAGGDEDIYYTLDGSDPVVGTNLYQGPIEVKDASDQENVYAARTDLSPTRNYTPPFKVDKATIVRAVSHDREKGVVSRIVSKVYFVGYGQREEYLELPVLSLVTDPSNLFDRESGIYGNGVALEQYKADGGVEDGKLLESFVDADGDTRQLYMASNAFNDGKEWEREAALTCFDKNHEYSFTQNVGIRIAGQSTRSRIQKSLRIYGRSIYDQTEVFPYEFFPGCSYSTIKLRNGGNNNETVMITDAFLEKMAEGRNVSIQDSTPCVLFLNGEYWGIYNIRERYGEEYLSNHFGVNEDNVWIIDSEAAKAGGGEAWEAYDSMLNLVMECDLAYDDVYEMLDGFIDMQSLIDYCCINLYVNNRDIALGTNTALWRTAEPEESVYGDCRWRWMLYDMDISLFHDENVPITWMEDYPLLNEPVIEKLMINGRFRREFCLTFMDIANTVYAYDTVHERLLEWEKIYEAQVVKTQRRFWDEGFTTEEFGGYIAEMDEFFNNRFSFAMASLADYFELSGGLETICIRNSLPEGGSVRINTALLRDNEWSGRYFTDYPVTVTAIPQEGYRFAGWKGDITGQNEQTEVNIPAGGITIEAIFERVE